MRTVTPPEPEPEWFLEERPDNATCKPFATPLPATYSATGCADETQLIPYGVNSPLWSDAAEKKRFMALPNDGVIAVGSDGDFDMPVGTVLIKEFARGGVKIETRFLMRNEKAWKGYTYLWRADQTDADLVSDSINGRYVEAGGSTWYLPSRNECFVCHTNAAGQSLGLEIAQLTDEMPTLQHIGVVPAELPEVAPLAAWEDLTLPAEDRARGYLHANCSFCHRAGGSIGSLELRATKTFFETSTCNVTSERAGEEALRRIVPQDPEHSLIILRMRGEGARMPPIGSLVPDDTAVAVMREWINAIVACPEN